MISIKLGSERMAYGENAVETLRDLSSERKRAYIVMRGRTQEELGQLKLVTDEFEKGGFTWKAYFDVEPEPSFDTILRGAADMAAFEPDWIIGFGGGSAMDLQMRCGYFTRTPSVKRLLMLLAKTKFRNCGKRRE